MHHSHKLEDLILLRYQFSLNSSIDLLPNKSQNLVCLQNWQADSKNFYGKTKNIPKTLKNNGGHNLSLSLIIDLQ